MGRISKKRKQSVRKGGSRHQRAPAGGRLAGAPKRKGSKSGRGATQKRKATKRAVRRPGTGFEVMISVVEVHAGQRDESKCQATTLHVPGGQGVAGALAQSARSFARRTRLEALAGVLSAFGSRHRLGLLVKLLEGPCTYQTLKKASKLQTGPLYHHINHLRLAGLLTDKQRDLYHLTRAGRNVLLVALSLGPLMKDRRARPVITPDEVRD